jgi:hypothetical protein
MKVANQCDRSSQFSWTSGLLSKVYRTIFEDCKTHDSPNIERKRIQVDKSMREELSRVEDCKTHDNPNTHATRYTQKIHSIL